jgi:3-dehydroquinate synthase
MIRVNLGPRSYGIAFAAAGDSFLDFVSNAVPRAKAMLVVCDANTRSLAETLAPRGSRIATVPAGESSKCQDRLDDLYAELAAIPADRQTAVIAVGGGVIGDLAGFAAATYNRGLPLVMVPTTLLAMVDSSVGGKTGINIPAGKNLVGAFHQPAGVWIDPAMLDSLPEREFRAGLAEVVKYGVIADADFLVMLERDADRILARDPATIRDIVKRSCQIKADVVERDEFETTGLRATLNYGHTYAHAFEAVAGYGAWRHGEAVAAGMVCASRLAERLGRIGTEVTERQILLLKRFGLPTEPDPSWPRDRLLESMRRDKKAIGGTLRFVLPTRLGHVELVDGVAEAIVFSP